MNKYEELKNRIDEEIKSIKEHELKLNELKEEIGKVKEEERSNNEIPFKLGDGYYSIAVLGDICFDKWDNDGIDRWKLNQGNTFKTEQEAGDKLFQLRLEGKAREFRRINNCSVTEKDLRDSNKFNYCIYYSLISGIIIESHSVVIRPNKLGYFNSEEMTEKFMEENKEDLIKYFDIEMKLNK